MPKSNERHACPTIVARQVALLGDARRSVCARANRRGGRRLVSAFPRGSRFSATCRSFHPHRQIEDLSFSPRITPARALVRVASSDALDGRAGFADVDARHAGRPRGPRARGSVQQGRRVSPDRRERPDVPPVEPAEGHVHQDLRGARAGGARRRRRGGQQPPGDVRRGQRRVLVGRDVRVEASPVQGARGRRERRRVRGRERRRARERRFRPDRALLRLPLGTRRRDPDARRRRSRT